MKIVLASRNPKKISELRTLLQSYVPEAEILSLDDVGIFDEIVEDGATFEENAKIKSRAAAQSGYIGVGDDSGLTVDALNGAPGIYSARFAERIGFGKNHHDSDNNEALLSAMESYPDALRGAAFVCVVSCTFPDGRELTVKGEARGRILREYRGADGFGYDPLFLCDGTDKTFAELSPEEKNRISHRGKAMRAFAEGLKEYLK